MASGYATTSSTESNGLLSYVDILGGCNLSSSSSSNSRGCSSSEYGSPHDSDSEILDVGKPSTSFVTTTTLEESAAETDSDKASSSEGDESDCDDGPMADGSTPAVKVPQVTLVNKGDFLPRMEIQISPQGRPMQPWPTVRFVNLLDDLQYAVWISFVQECGQMAGDYMHPDAPLPGSYWNERLVSFSRLKLYSFDGTSFKKPITLVCNRSYFLQINFGIVNDAGHILANTVIRKGIVGTWFVPVNYNRPSSSGKKPSIGNGPPSKRAKPE